MAKLTVANPTGQFPRINAFELAENAAQVARNCTLGAGDIRPTNTSRLVATSARVGTKQTIFRLGNDGGEVQYWLTWPGKVDVARGPIANDTSERIYYTGDGFPKVSNLSLATQGGTVYPVNSYRLGVPAPDLTATAAATGTGDTTMAPETRVYAYTYVSSFGEEGMPTGASNQVVVYPGQSVNLTGMSAAPTGAYDITHKRIYRSAVGSSGQGALQFVAEIPIAQTTYADSVAGTALGEMLATATYAMPPETMEGLTVMQNGVMAAFDGNDILFCPPYLPYAYPEEYRQTSEYKVVGLGAFGQSLVVCTTGTPYLITGTEPENMSMERVELVQACVSKRSIVEVGTGVIYASNDGLVYVGAGGSRVVTESGFFSQGEWASYIPSSMHAHFWDGKVVVFYEKTSQDRGAMIFENILGQQPVLTFSDEWSPCAYVDPQSGGLYMLDGDNIVRFSGSATAKVAIWKSKKFVSGDGLSLACAKVYADAYPVTFRIYADGALLHSKTVQDRQPFRLPAIRAEYYELEIEGDKRVTRIMAATSMEEMRDV